MIVSWESTHWLNIDGEWRQYVHIYVVVGVTRSKIDKLIDALHAPTAFNWRIFLDNFVVYNTTISYSHYSAWTVPDLQLSAQHVQNHSYASNVVQQSHTVKQLRTSQESCPAVECWMMMILVSFLNVNLLSLLYLMFTWCHLRGKCYPGEDWKPGLFIIEYSLFTF